MNIQYHDEDGKTVFVMEGRIDTEGAGDLENRLQEALAQGKTQLVLDMTGVRYISSAGLRTLADILTRAKDQQGDLKLVGLAPKVLRVFQIIGFDNFFSMYDSVGEAVAAFS